MVKDQTQEIAVNDMPNIMTVVGNMPGSIVTTMDLAQPHVADRLFNALNADAKKVSDMINKPIKIKDVYAENVEGLNEETGEFECYTMIVIFDADGTAYRCSSIGMKNALRRAFAMFGHPSTWPDGGLEFEVLQLDTPKGRTFTLKRIW